MGARPSSFRKSGGFLNGVDGVITGYAWTDEFNGEPFKAGKVNGKDKFHSLYLVPQFRLDGADEDTITTLFGGGYEDYVVSEDGLTLTSTDGTDEKPAPCSIGQNTAAAKFIASLCEAGFPEENFSDDPNTVNFEPMIGTRVRLVQKTDAESTKKLGQRVDKKTGKKYDRQDLVVDQVYPGTETAKAAPKAAAGKAAPKGKAAKADEAGELDALATDTLLGILGENDGTIAKAKISTKVLMYAGLKGHPQKEAVRKRLFDEAFLATQAGWVFEKKTGAISLEA